MVVLNMKPAVRSLAALFLLSMIAAPGSSPASSQPQGRRVIEITAERFEFWPSEIRLREGEEVEFHLRSEDTAHGFRIIGAGTNVIVPKRGKGAAVAVFRAGKAGRYTFECSRMCGAGHNFMRGELVVREVVEGARP
jgi:cytochrome c oxidase subunit 2